MQIETFKPQNKELQNYIESYYILEHSEDEGNISYLTFPSVYSIVAVVNNAKNIIRNKDVTTKFSKSKSLDTSLVCRFNEPICFQYQGNIKEICIYFKPLGLNAFLKSPLKEYGKSYFEPFAPFSDYEKEMKRIIELDNKMLLVEHLEKYWLNKMIGFNHPFLKTAISIIGEHQKISTKELAHRLNVSQKTLIHHFKNHICKTPSEYRKILRFRKALTTMKGLKKKTTLTELSNIIDFFDQSHMISNFKSLTGMPPRTFFKKLTTMENRNIHWIFN